MRRFAESTCPCCKKNSIIQSSMMLKSSSALLIQVALQTAEILNRHRDLPLFVEHDLREWRADKEGGYITLNERDRRWLEYRELLKAGIFQWPIIATNMLMS